MMSLIMSLWEGKVQKDVVYFIGKGSLVIGAMEIVTLSAKSVIEKTTLALPSQNQSDVCLLHSCIYSSNISAKLNS